MELEVVKRRQSVREGYVVLLRAEAEILLPESRFPMMRTFYEKIGDACLNWVIDVYGERLREYFLSLSDIREKSRFRTQTYRFWMRVPWETSPHLTLLCESERSDLDGSKDFYRIAHTWNTEEETVLPLAQVMRLFQIRVSKHDFPFEADGGYREGEHFLIFKNKTASNAFLEMKFPIKGG